jgi:long-chain acyl-CoA synthetase
MYAAEHARSDPDKPAIVMATSGEVVTFAEYEAAANRVAQLLRDSGLRRRDHVAIFMNNDPRMLMSEGGAERTGLYYTCANSYLSVEEVAYIVNDSESKVFMTSGAKADVALQLPALCPNVERWFMAGGRGDQGPFESWEEAIAGHPPTQSQTSNSVRRCRTRRVPLGARRASFAFSPTPTRLTTCASSRE